MLTSTDPHTKPLSTPVFQLYLLALHMSALHGREAHIKPAPQQWLGQLFFSFTEFSLQLLRITIATL